MENSGFPLAMPQQIIDYKVGIEQIIHFCLQSPVSSRRFCDKCDECDEGNEENEIFYILLFIFFYSFMISHRHTCHNMAQPQYSSVFQL